MKRLLGLMAIMLMLMNCHAQAALGHDPALDWYTVESEHFKIHYHEGLEAIARDTLSLAEQVHRRLTKKFDWQPAGKTHVVLTDEYDLSNGMATPYPYNWMTLFVAPPDDLASLEDHAGWLETVFTHEYVHVLHLDKATGFPATLRQVFGRHFLLFPNLFQPRWLIEGLATYEETDTQRGIGRGQSALYDGMMRTEVMHGIKPLRQVNQPLASWPSGTTAYLYGVYFYEFLSEAYGEKKIQALIDHYSNNILPFFINNNARGVFGKDLSQLWQEFETYLHGKFDPQIAAIRAMGIVEGQRLSHDGYFTGPLRVLADGRAYYIAYNGERHTRLMRINPDRSIEALTEVNRGSRLDVHPTAGVLLLQPENCSNATIYYDLYRVDLQGDGLERLSECGRYRHAAWSPDGQRIVAVKNQASRNELHILDRNGVLQEVVWRGQDWETVGAIDWSPTQDHLIAAVWRPATGWNLERFDLQHRQWTALSDDMAIDNQPQYTVDGRYILYSSDHGGVYNVRRYDTYTGQTITLTNCLGGAIFPAMSAEGDLFYIGYSGDGLDVYYLPRSRLASLPTPVVAKGPSGQPMQRTLEVKAAQAEPYSPWETLRPYWWFPHLLFDEQRSEIGVVTGGSDSLQRHNYALDLAYDTENAWWLGQADYVYDGWYPLLKLNVEHEYDFFLDNNDKVSRIRRDINQRLEIVFPLIHRDSSWSFNLAAIKKQSEDAYRATGVTALAKTTDNVAGAALVYDSTERHIKSVSRSSGRDIALVMEDSDALGDSDYTGRVYLADWREFIRLGGEHVLALRYVEGRGTDNPNPFRLGGIEDDGSSISSLLNPYFNTPFDRREFALRGYPEGLPQLIGRRMRLGSAEYRFPIQRIERGFMAPPLGVDQVHGSLFYDIGTTWEEDNEEKHYYRGYGMEVNVDTVLFYYLPVQLAFGYAKGIDAGGEDKYYIRLGASF